MISVRLADVPLYLREGGFFQGLDTKASEELDSEESVSVPVNTLKADDSVNNNEDLVHLLTSLRFWAVPRLPQGVLAFVISDPTFSTSEEFEAFLESFPVLPVLVEIHSSAIYAVPTMPPMSMSWFGMETPSLGSPFPPMPSLDAALPAKPPTQRGCIIAIKHDLVEVLEYLISIGSKVFPSDKLAAASLGSLNCLTYLHHNLERCDLQEALHAADGGHLHILKFLHEQECGWDATVCAKAASQGHIECLKFLHEVGCPWNQNTINDAGAQGHLDCLMYAHREGLPFTDVVLLLAAMGRHVECLNYLHEQGVPWTTQMCAYAAQRGKLSTLQCLHEMGCPWDSNTTVNAALFRRYDCLKYAVEHGCEWDLDQYEFLNALEDPEKSEAARQQLETNCTQS